MIFTPYVDELQVINFIHQYNSNEYVVIRLTETMIEKNIIDANALLRDLLKENGVVDYDYLKSKNKVGGKNGEKYEADFILGDSLRKHDMRFYLANKRGDRRFSIYGIKKLAESKLVKVGDLLYITVNIKEDGPVVTLMNVTSNTPSPGILTSLFDEDKTREALGRLIPLVRNIAKKGYHPNSKGVGKAVPKDAGDTLEFLLGIKANNSQKADFEDLIEIKSKTAKTLDTLFTLRPRFDGTPISKIEPIDRNRVSAFTRKYGYISEKHPDSNSLYITIGSEDAPQNNQGFYLVVNDEERTIELWKKDTKGKSVLTAYWYFNDLERELYQKHPTTLWVKAETQMVNGLAEFKYVKAELSRSPQFATFLSLVKSGGITYDWRGYTSLEGKYKGKNHGNAWRIKSKQKVLLFGSMEIIDLLCDNHF